MKVTDVVKKDRMCTFSFYRQGYLYYEVLVSGEGKYCFPVEVSDLGGATLNKEEKTITMMRYIRKAIEGEMFVRVA